MSVFKVCYFATLFIIVWFADYFEARCYTPNGEIIQAGKPLVVDCVNLHLCDLNSQLHTYPACRTNSKCGNPKAHRDLDASKPWPECCALDIC